MATFKQHWVDMYNILCLLCQHTPLGIYAGGIYVGRYDCPAAMLADCPLLPPILKLNSRSPSGRQLVIKHR